MAKSFVESAEGDARFTTLVAALKAADLTGVLQRGKVTVFAPTNDAFEKLPEGTVDRLLQPENRAELVRVLSYHVVSGEKLGLGEVLKRGELDSLAGLPLQVQFDEGRIRVNKASLLIGDVEGVNGIIHGIDAVLLPPDPGPKSIAGVAQEAGLFNTLLTAVEAAGLSDVLAGDGPFTVFAPTDEAFAKVDKKVLADVLLPENKAQLAALLEYHVVAGKVSAGDALNAGDVETVLGANVSVALKGGVVRAQWAKVLTGDVPASNGVIHVIDAVMLPPNWSATAPEAPRDRIEVAINKGVPLFNQGHEAQCAEVYLKVSKELLQTGGLPRRAEMALQIAVKSAGHVACDSTRAWTLRRGLDRAYAVLAH